MFNQVDFIGVIRKASPQSAALTWKHGLMIIPDFLIDGFFLKIIQQ